MQWSIGCTDNERLHVPNVDFKPQLVEARGHDKRDVTHVLRFVKHKHRTRRHFSPGGRYVK